MSDNQNLADGFGNAVVFNETGMEIEAAPGKNLNINSSHGGQVLINGLAPSTGGVASFNGRTGVVVPEANDYTGITNLSLDDGVSLIEFDSTNGEIVMQDGTNNDSVTLDGSGNATIAAQSQIQLNAPTVLINGSPIAAPPIFVDAEVPSTFTTNHAYDLANVPNPPESLQVFVDDTSLGDTGCNVLLVQGVDYTLTNGGTRIQYATAIITNKIVCFYRM